MYSNKFERSGSKMSYEKDYETPYRAECACGQGFLRFYRNSCSNDWGQVKEDDTFPELFCDECKIKYHIEKKNNVYFLVPNSLSFPKHEPHFDREYRYNYKEELVLKYSKNDIEGIIADMTAPKHRYIKDLKKEISLNFVNEWLLHHRERSLKPMIAFLEQLLIHYDEIRIKSEEKKVLVEEYEREYTEFCGLCKNVEEQSVRLSFFFDNEQCEIERENNILAREKYKEEHQYDDFTAQVHYDSSYKKDFTNQYWDSYFIKKCTDSQYLILHKPEYGTPKITVAKKYLCVCQICGKEKEILSSNMRISKNDSDSYYPIDSCNCHIVSSFEAKTMEILNQLGIKYIREKSFDGLTGDKGKPLRFDFALYQSCDEKGGPNIDLLIELQGPHHFKEGYYNDDGDYVTDDIDCNSENRLLLQQKYDNMKKQFCLNNEIDLECIKYTASQGYEKLEKIVVGILQKYGYRYYI